MTPELYLQIFLRRMDDYAEKHNLKRDDLSNGELRDMIYDVAEDIRSLYGLSSLQHEGARDSIMAAFFGKDKGRK